MAFQNKKIANCRTASIRKAPWIAECIDDVVQTKKRGEQVEVDPSDICYDWTDRVYFRTKNPKGWIHEGVLEN